MELFATTIFLLGGAWTCLVTFLVLGMCRQNRYLREKVRRSKASSSDFDDENVVGNSAQLSRKHRRDSSNSAASSTASTFPPVYTLPSGTEYATGADFSSTLSQSQSSITHSPMPGMYPRLVATQNQEED
jgi:hypothetical protein